MNRRRFFQALGIAAASVYLRLAPEKLTPPKVEYLTHYWFQGPMRVMPYSAAYKAALEKAFEGRDPHEFLSAFWKRQ